MLWEHKPTGKCFDSFSEFSKLPRVFLSVDRNTENIVYFFHRSPQQKKKTIFLTCAIVLPTAHASSVSIKF